jgi:hypothetical protein
MREEAKRALNIVLRHGKDNENKRISSVFSLNFCRTLHNISPQERERLLLDAKKMA